MLHAIAPEAPGRDEATRVRYRHRYSLSGAMYFSRVLPPELLFPDEWQDQHQQEGLYFTSTITYYLREDNSRVGISEGVCTLQTQSLTLYRKAMAASASARGSALCKHNHLLAVGQWQNQHQQEGLHFVNTITYRLWECNGKISISKRVCTLPAQSLTGCGKAIVGSASARGSTL
jgi:hypothetical protein